MAVLIPHYNDSLPTFEIDMAVYTLHFYYEYKNFTGTQVHRVELLGRGYMGEVIEITKGSVPPIVLSHSGPSKDEWEDVIIQGQGIEFNFYVDRNHVYLLDSIFESDYRDYQLKYFIDGVVEFIGWIQPENLTKNYSKNPPNIEISITANDGLVDLKDEKFVMPSTSSADGLPYTGRIRLLEIIKTALSRAGIPLDFSVQLNTWEGLYVPPDPPAEVVGILQADGLVSTVNGFPLVITTEDGKVIKIDL